MDWQTHTLPDAFTLTGIAIGFLLICTQAIFLAPDEAAIHLTTQHALRLSSPGSFIERGNVFLTGPEAPHLRPRPRHPRRRLASLLIRSLYKAFRGQEGLGLGDVKLLAMIAAFLGFCPALLAFILGCILIASVRALPPRPQQADRTTQLPFGSFLCAGGLLAALVGEPLIAWYISLF